MQALRTPSSRVVDLFPSQAAANTNSTTAADKKDSSSSGYNWRKIAVRAVQVVAVVLVASLVLSSAGHLLSVGGAKLLENVDANKSVTSFVLSKIGIGSQATGSALSLLGKYTFLSVSVPAYTLGYVAPKWVATVGIPQALNLSHTYIYLPLEKLTTAAVTFISTQVGNVAELVHQYALKPLGNIIEYSANFVWNNVLIPVGEGIVKYAGILSEKMAGAAQVIYECALKPFGHMAANAAVGLYNHVLCPLGNATVYCAIALRDLAVNVGNAALEYAIKPLGTALAKLGTLSLEYVILPIGNALEAFGKIASNCIASTAQAINTYVLEPLGHGISYCINNLAIPAINNAGRGLSAFCENILQPLGSATVKVATVLWNYAVMPVINGLVNVSCFVGKGIAMTAQAVHAYVLSPVGAALMEGCYWAADAGAKVCHGIADVAYNGFQSVKETFTWIASKF